MRRLITVLVMLTSLALAAAAQTPSQTPSLTGKWKLNLTKSTLGSDHPRSDYQLTWTLTQTKDTLQITESSTHVSMMNIPLPDSSSTSTYTTDGQEREVQLPGILPFLPKVTMSLRAEWQGATLAINQRSSTQSSATSGSRRIYLSPDGSELIELVESHSGYGDGEQRLVFDREH
jgi:hypothetical protein